MLELYIKIEALMLYIRSYLKCLMIETHIQINRDELFALLYDQNVSTSTIVLPLLARICT